MSNRLNLQLPQHLHDTPWNPEEVLAEALAERAEFLNQHPKYQDYQKEINRLLDNAGNAENRMMVLAMLMEGKLIELHHQLHKLNKILLANSAPGGFRNYLNARPDLLRLSNN